LKKTQEILAVLLRLEVADIASKVKIKLYS
jgi:hypothetical protein